jgi:putative DNA primase/helicase
VCRIDPDIERPERASFPFDPVDYVRSHRVDLVHDLLVILRAYVLAGRPEQGGHEIGSFGDWARLVRDSLMWLGEADGAESIDLSRASAVPDLELLLPLWAAAFGTGPGRARKAKDLLGHEISMDSKRKDFGDCLVDDIISQGADKKSNVAAWLGRWLGAKCDQRAAGFKLMKRRLQGVWLWYVDDDNPVD